VHQNDVTVSIVVPTYNEQENVALLCEGIGHALEGKWSYEVIIVDDNSPDGTAGVVRRLAQADPRIQLVQRPGKMGLGSAIRDGFRQARGNYWVMMDADLSHPPRYLPALLHTLFRADIAVGSRYMRGGAVENWPRLRRLASRTANLYGRLVVGLSTKDVTSGFAAFQRGSMESLLPGLSPKGFKLLLEILAKSKDTRIEEVPFRFVDRKHGRSKFSFGEVLLYLRLCWRLRRERKHPSAE
jgi:dolichol-phosphate mannosyltransferase